MSQCDVAVMMDGSDVMMCDSGFILSYAEFIKSMNEDWKIDSYFRMPATPPSSPEEDHLPISPFPVPVQPTQWRFGRVVDVCVAATCHTRLGPSSSSGGSKKASRRYPNSPWHCLRVVWYIRRVVIGSGSGSSDKSSSKSGGSGSGSGGKSPWLLDPDQRLTCVSPWDIQPLDAADHLAKALPVTSSASFLFPQRLAEYCCTVLCCCSECQVRVQQSVYRCCCDCLKQFTFTSLCRSMQ